MTALPTNHHLSILKTAIDQYEISNIVYITGEKNAWTIIETKTIFIPPPGTLFNLLLGLHEVGHIALGHPPRRSGKWTLLEKKRNLKEEQEAWKFAFQEIDNHEIFINIETLRACHDQYREYIKIL